MMETQLGEFCQMLYGPALWGYEEQAGGGVKVDFGSEYIVLDSFVYDSGLNEITYSYASIAPAVSQGVNTQGTQISIKMVDAPAKCTLTTTYTLPPAAAASYPAKVYYTGVIHSLIDNCQLELGGVDCAPYPGPTLACHAPQAASFTPLRREASGDPAYVGDGPASVAVSARHVSNSIMDQGDDESVTQSKLSSLFTIFGQFVDHDIGLTPGGEGKFRQDWNIEVGPTDVLYDDSPEFVGLRFSRSQYVRKDNATPYPRNQLNVVTALIDGSQIYGNTWEKMFALRSFVGGKLRTGAGGNLPPRNGAELAGVYVKMDPSPDLPGIFATGDQRGNENEVLLSIHTLFIKEHNKVCDELKGALGNASDEEYFQHARRVVIAELQAIIFKEWLPLFLGNFNAPSFRQSASAKEPQLSAAFSTAAFRFGHSMVTEALLRLGPNNTPVAAGPQSLPKSLFNVNEIAGQGIDVYLRGAINQLARNLDNKVITQLRNILFKEANIEGLTGLDLPSLNIQRGRDHGIPTLASMRSLVGAGASTYRPGCEEGFVAAYGAGWQNQVELFPGGLCESPARFALVGATFSAIIKDQFERLRDGDPHWFTELTKDFPKLKKYPRAFKIQSGSEKIASIIERNTGVSRFDMPSFKTAFQGQAAFTLPVSFQVADQDRFDVLVEASVVDDPAVAGLASDADVSYEAQAALDGVSTLEGDESLPLEIALEDATLNR